MPNDMSHGPAPPDSAALLALRTDRYVTRAQALVDDPGLTTEQAARALDHLADLQAALAEARLCAVDPAKRMLRQTEKRFEPHETRLLEARAALSSALLRARPAGEPSYGIVPHTQAPDSVIEGEDADPNTGEAAAPGPRAVSACRALLDLDTLRPYLSEHALRRAIDAHATDTGRSNLRGVTYAALPASAHLPCPIA